ncbi:MAG TPA: TetR/AcrR family transcriptional regulator [Alteromonas sp.]|nr:TetR family transcriptional regulator [Alteromonadaceae bacterium]MAX42584.1 TetR family transcriptional regulator [Alteromonadaceae bacterium]HBY38043.1 TetR/AcrR family transcriptional regulator [Alteromonas sp.]|tara:strand:- start:1147 stop:1719 length:573 start_codon:yes stop_codon:yes gene_type:complete
MPRKSLYDVNAIMEQAVDIFLEHSFHGAVMEEIIARTEFNRRGFYLEFGSKQQFLYDTLSYYHEHTLAPIVQHLENHHGIASIEAFFDAYISVMFGRGCLLINMVTELGHDDTTIQSIGRHYLDRLQLGFIGCLEQAQRQGTVKTEINVEAVALQLTCFVQGFAVNSILAETKEELHIATQALLNPIITA